MLEFFTEISKYVNVLLMIVFAISGLYAVLNKKITRRAFGDFCAYQRVVIILFNLQSGALIFFHELGGGRTLEFVRMFGIAWIAPVSYTHLDVYKRQVLERIFEGEELGTYFYGCREVLA